MQNVVTALPSSILQSGASAFTDTNNSQQKAALPG